MNRLLQNLFPLHHLKCRSKRVQVSMQAAVTSSNTPGQVDKTLQAAESKAAELTPTISYKALCAQAEPVPWLCCAHLVAYSFKLLYNYI